MIALLILLSCSGNRASDKAASFHKNVRGGNISEIVKVLKEMGEQALTDLKDNGKSILDIIKDKGVLEILVESILSSGAEYLLDIAINAICRDEEGVETIRSLAAKNGISTRSRVVRRYLV